MFITVLATLCHLVAGVNACVEEIVTDNSIDQTLTMQSCMMGEAYVAKWISEHPLYHTGYTLQKWSCRMGNKAAPPPEGKA